MTKRLLACLTLAIWVAGCAEDPVSIGSGPGGTPADHLDIIPLMADTLFQEEIPLVGASQLWVGQHNDFAVNARLLLQFFEFDATAPWVDNDTLTLDSVSLVLSHRTDGLGSFQVEAHSQLRLQWVELECGSCSDLARVVNSSLYDENDLPLFTTHDTLIISDVIPDTAHTLTTAQLPLDWLFESETNMFRDTVNLLLEMEYYPELDTTSGYLHTFNAKDVDEDDWPRMLFFYHSDMGETDTLVQYVRYDTYLLEDNAVPGEGDLFISVGDAWQFALRFEDIDYHWEDEGRTDTEHSLATETVHSAQIHLYPQSTTITPWRFGEAASTQVWDLLAWDADGNLEIDTLIAQTSYTEGADFQRVDINVTQLVNRWLTREDYLGVLMRVSQAGSNLNPVRMVYHSITDTTGKQPELWIYRSESPF